MSARNLRVNGVRADTICGAVTSFPTAKTNNYVRRKTCRENDGPPKLFADAVGMARRKMSKRPRFGTLTALYVYNIGNRFVIVDVYVDKIRTVRSPDYRKRFYNCSWRAQFVWVFRGVPTIISHRWAIRRDVLRSRVPGAPEG